MMGNEILYKYDKIRGTFQDINNHINIIIFLLKCTCLML